MTSAKRAWRTSRLRPTATTSAVRRTTIRKASSSTWMRSRRRWTAAKRRRNSLRSRSNTPRVRHGCAPEGDGQRRSEEETPCEADPAHQRERTEAREGNEGVFEHEERADRSVQDCFEGGF